MARLLRALILAFLFVATEAACTQSTAPAETVTMKKTCVQTACESINESRSAHCSHCLAECGSLDGCDSSTICDTICTPEPCGRDLQELCEKEGWTAEVSAPATPGAEQACLAVWDNFQKSCGVTISDENENKNACARAAHVFNAAAVPVLTCQAATSCDGEEHDDCGVGVTTFGDELCATIAARCPPYGKGDGYDLCKELNTTAFFMKPAMLDAARQCAAQPCEEVDACMKAWWKAF